MSICSFWIYLSRFFSFNNLSSVVYTLHNFLLLLFQTVVSLFMKWSIENYLWVSKGKVGNYYTMSNFAWRSNKKYLRRLCSDTVSGDSSLRKITPKHHRLRENEEKYQLWMRFINDNKQSLQKISFCT